MKRNEKSRLYKNNVANSSGFGKNGLFYDYCLRVYLWGFQMTQTPEQIAEAQQKAEDYLRKKYGAYRGHFAWRELEEALTTGHLRAKTEQATEIAELKEYKQLYEDAMGVSNAAGWSGVSVAQVIEQQDAEIAKLKAKLAEVLPLAKFGATVLRTYSHNGDITEGQVHNAAKQTNCMHDAKAFTVFSPKIEATIEQLLED